MSVVLALTFISSHASDKPSNQTDRNEFNMDKITAMAGLDLQRPSATAIDRAVTLLLQEKKKGIWLAAPARLAIDQDHDVTVLAFDCYDPSVRGYRYLSESGIVVATRIESRETFAALVEEPKPMDDDVVPVNEEPMPSSDAVQGFSIALRERLGGLPWRAGNYIVDVMLDKEVSNRARFQITAGIAAERDAAVAAFIEQQRSTSSAPKELRPLPEPGDAVPNYRKTANSLPLPPEVGITLAAERVSVFRPGSRNVLRGSYRLPVPAAFYRSGNGDGVSATAAVPITLVVVGNIMPGPFVAPLAVASYDRIERGATESVVSGYFEIDLFALRETSKVPQTYSIWAYSGEVRSAPVLAAVVTPEMLK